MSIQQLLSEYGLDYLVSYLTTLHLTALAFVLAFFLGIAVTVMRICPLAPLRRFGDFYVQVFRNIPGAALLILLVYALPYLNLVLSYYLCLLIAITLIPSSFMSEHLISGINTIDRGQVEAARSLGLRFFQIIRKIIMPQALRATVLPMTNLLIATMLTTALGSQVPLDPRELTGLVAHINTYAVGGIKAFVITAFFYCLTAFLIAFAGNRLDRKVRRIG